MSLHPPVAFTSTRAFEGFTELQFDHDPRVDPSGSDTVVAFACCESRRPPRPDLNGQYFDEVTLGYERAVGRELRAGIRGMYRVGRSVVDVFDPAIGDVSMGNPGRGDLSSAPRPRHTYTALMLTFEKPEGRLNFPASYALSRT